MLEWEERPFEIAYGLNPAFLAILIYQAVKSFEKKNSDGMPYVLSALVIPLVFYKPIREILPKLETENIHDWLENNPQILINLSTKISQLIPYFKEAIVFGMQHQILNINHYGKLTTTLNKLDLNSLNWIHSSKTYQVSEKAKFLGKWFSELDNPEIIYRSLGIKP